MSSDPESPVGVLEASVAALREELHHRKYLEQSLRVSIEEGKLESQRLRESRAEFLDFLDNAAEGIHWVDANGKILWANRSELKMLGYEFADYVGHHIAEFHADAPVIADILARLTRDETLINHEARLKAKDGSIIDVSISSNVNRHDGEFVHTRCFTRDVTKHRAELARLKAEHLVIVTDANGRVLYFDEGEPWGYALVDLVGTVLNRVWAEPSPARVEGRVNRTVYLKDGGIMKLSFTVTLMRDAAGNDVGDVWRGRDLNG